MSPLDPKHFASSARTPQQIAQQIRDYWMTRPPTADTTAAAPDDAHNRFIEELRTTAEGIGLDSRTNADEITELLGSSAVAYERLADAIESLANGNLPPQPIHRKAIEQALNMTEALAQESDQFADKYREQIRSLESDSTLYPASEELDHVKCGIGEDMRRNQRCSCELRGPITGLFRELADSLNITLVELERGK